MSRSDEETVTLTCPLNDVEQDMAAEMMRATGITSQCNLVRLGLWHLARHLDMPTGSRAFGQRGSRGGAKRIKSPRLSARVLTDHEIAESEKTA